MVDNNKFGLMFQASFWNNQNPTTNATNNTNNDSQQQPQSTSLDFEGCGNTYQQQEYNPHTHHHEQVYPTKAFANNNNSQYNTTVPTNNTFSILHHQTNNFKDFAPNTTNPTINHHSQQEQHSKTIPSSSPSICTDHNSLKKRKRNDDDDEDESIIIDYEEEQFPNNVNNYDLLHQNNNNTIASANNNWNCSTNQYYFSQENLFGGSIATNNNEQQHQFIHSSPSNNNNNNSLLQPFYNNNNTNSNNHSSSYNNNTTASFHSPLFESEQDMINATLAFEDHSSISNNGNNKSMKRNKMSPQSHLTDFIRDNIMQYLLFHLKVDVSQTDNHDESTMSDDEAVVEASTDMDIAIPVGLLLDYIVQQAQRLYFNMYEYIRELALCQINNHHSSNTLNLSVKEQEMSLACNEFEKMVIEQVHFLMGQIKAMRSNNSDSVIITILKKYERILPKNFRTLRLVSGIANCSGIGSDVSFTSSIVDDSSLFKSKISSSNFHQHSMSFTEFDDMKTNNSLNNISSLLLNSNINFSALSKFLKH